MCHLRLTLVKYVITTIYHLLSNKQTQYSEVCCSQMQAELKLLVNFSEGESRCYDREITAVASLMQFTQVLQQIYYVWTLKYT